MRKPIIAGNWKMNTTIKEALSLVAELKAGLTGSDNVEKLICPPFVSLYALYGALKETSIKLGAQNLYYEAKGAFTGEISPGMIAELCEYVIIGHSERRQFFGDTNEVVNKKILAALEVGLKPILCVGESLAENQSGNTEEIVTGQISASLAEINYNKDMVIAYEPVWAIGTGLAATSQQANDTIGIIRTKLTELYGDVEAQNTRILYGGSVNAANIFELMKQPEIDGGLVGGASLKADEFISLVKQTADLYK